MEIKQECLWTLCRQAQGSPTKAHLSWLLMSPVSPCPPPPKRTIQWITSDAEVEVLSSGKTGLFVVLYFFFFKYCLRMSSSVVLMTLVVCSRLSAEPQSFSASMALWGHWCVCTVYIEWTTAEHVLGPSFEPGVGSPNRAVYASPTDRNFAFLSFPSLVHSTSFFTNPLPTVWDVYHEEWVYELCFALAVWFTMC